MMFQKLSVEEARAQASKENKLLLIDIGAEWCAPCRTMNETTWRNDEVVRWLGSPSRFNSMNAMPSRSKRVHCRR